MSGWRYQAIQIGKPFAEHLNCDKIQDAIQWATERGLDVNVWRRQDGELVREIRQLKGESSAA